MGNNTSSTMGRHGGGSGPHGHQRGVQRRKGMNEEDRPHDKRWQNGKIGAEMQTELGDEAKAQMAALKKQAKEARANEGAPTGEEGGRCTDMPQRSRIQWIL